MNRPNRLTSDALAIIDRRYFRSARRRRALVAAVLDAEIAQEIYALRAKAGLSRKKLARLAGTTDSVISRLEDADYDRLSLPLLQQIGTALNCRLEIRFVPPRRRARTA
jgi:ribosome-binding protein aMBF1 (putative translation factor)